MPRYFFNIHDSWGHPDEDGVVLNIPKEARAQAVRGSLLGGLHRGLGVYRLVP